MRRIALVVLVSASALGAVVAVQEFELGHVLAAVLAVLLIVLAVRNLKAFLWAGLAFKPIIDIFYNDSIGRLSVQRIIGVIAPLLAIVLIFGSEVDVLAFPLVTPIFAFVLMNILGIVFSSNIGLGFEIFFRVAGPVAFYFVAGQLLPSDEAVRRFIKVLLIVLILPYAYALLQLAGIIRIPLIPVTGQLMAIRLYGPYAGPWDLARFIVVSVPLCLLVISETTDKTEAALWWLYLAANVIIAIFTNLKYAQITVPLELVLWFALTGQRAKVAAVIATASALVAANLGFLSQMYADVTVLFVTKNIASATGALSGRVGIWDQYLAQYQTMPLVYRIFGTGFDFARVIGSDTRIQADPHNDLLRTLVSNGWMGLAVYVWLLVAMGVFLIQGIRRLRAGGDEFRLKLCYATLCVYVSYVGGSLTARPSQYPSLAWYLWTLFGLLAVTLMTLHKVDDHG